MGPNDKPVVANLMQLYLHDSSEFDSTEPSAHGLFDFPWLDSYFTALGREAYLISVGGRPAGFALTRCDVEGDDGAWNLSEFFVVRGHRGHGVAARAVRLVLRRHPGPWTLSYLVANVPAARFWPRLIDAVASGPVVRTEQSLPEAAAPRVRLSFEVAADDGHRG